MTESFNRQAELDALENILQRQGQMFTKPPASTYSPPPFIASESFKPKTLHEIIEVCYGSAPFAGSDERDARPEKPANTSGRIKRGIFGAAFYLVLIAAVAVAIRMIGDNGNAPRNLFGYSSASVLTGSMQREIQQGSLVLVKHVDPNSIQIGDDITYMYNATTSVTHKVVGIVEDYNKTGKRGFQTQGVENKDPDKDIVPAKNIVGKVVWHVPVAGGVIHFINGNILILSAGLAAVGGLSYLFVLTVRWLLRPEPGESVKKKPRGKRSFNYLRA